MEMGRRARAGGCGAPDGGTTARLYSRTGEDMTAAFPDIVEMLGAIGGQSFSLDGELLIRREGLLQSFSVLQQRLNRKGVTARLLGEFPAHIRAYDLIERDGEDLRGLPFVERRGHLEKFVARRRRSSSTCRR